MKSSVFSKYFASPSAVIDVDTSGIHALEDLVKSLQKRDVQVKRPNFLLLSLISPFVFLDLSTVWTIYVSSIVTLMI